MTNNTKERNVEIPYFVGYHMAENGIGKAMIIEDDENTITIAICGDDEQHEKPFIVSKKDFNDNIKYLQISK